MIGRARVSGTLDRIDAESGKLVVTDYKTGNPLHSFTTTNKQLEVRAWKQRTQLIFYAMLLKRSPRFDTTTSEIAGQMIYLNADSLKDISRGYMPTGEEIERLEKLIQAVWNRVMAMDLPDISNYNPDYAGIQQFEEALLKEV